MHSMAVTSRLITPTTIKNCSVKCGFRLIMSAAMIEIEIHSRWQWRRRFAPLTIPISAVRWLPNMWLCTRGLYSQQAVRSTLTLPEKLKEEEDVEKHRTFLDATRRYLHQYDTKKPHYCNMQQTWKWIIQPDNPRRRHKELTGWRKCATRYASQLPLIPCQC
jgi:hypothetical protein